MDLVCCGVVEFWKVSALFSDCDKTMAPGIKPRRLPPHRSVAVARRLWRGPGCKQSLLLCLFLQNPWVWQYHAHGCEGG